MALLKDVTSGSMFGEDYDKRLDSLAKQANENFRLLSNEDRTKLIKDDSGTERLLTGYQQGGFSNGSVGIKLSQPGVDVLSATDEQLIFSSDFNMFKIVDKLEFTIDEFSVSTGSSGGFNGAEFQTQPPHEQGKVPAYLAFLEVSDGSWYPLGWANNHLSSSQVFGTFAVTIVATSVRFFIYITGGGWTSAGGGATITYTGGQKIVVYILKETADES